MSLASRLSLFFLSLLAFVLVGFSVALWSFQNWMLVHHADGILIGALDTLVASIEIEPDGVEWNPSEHRFDGMGDGHSDIRWRVSAGSGVIIDQSARFPRIAASEHRLGDHEIITLHSRDGLPWRLTVDHVSISADREASSDPGDDPEYSALVVTAATPIAHIQETMQRLTIALAASSIIVWLIAAVLGRYLVYRALRPLTAMGRAASQIEVTGGERLPIKHTGDEVEKLGNSFNDLLDRLQRAFERERRFTAEASHQLRTPITILLGQVDVALRRDRSDSEYRQTLAEVRHQGDRMRTIVETLLTLARSEAQPLERKSIMLADWLPAYLEDFASDPRSKDIKLLDEARNSTAVATSPELLSQLLDILVDNALKYTQPGTPVLLRLTREADSLVLDIIDSGPGIPEEQVADIFRPFHRGAEAINAGVPGLGLGLALARRIADRLGVGLEYHREPAGGSRFQIVFRPGPPSFSRSEEFQ